MAELTNNMNYLQPTNFKLVIDRKNFGNLEFFAQTVQHPSISITPAELPYKRANIYEAGDKVSFGELGATIILDEDMNSYIEMYNWIERLLEQKNRTPTAKTSTLLPSTADITVSVLSSHNNGNKKIRYIDCIPTLLGDINFEATTDTIQYLTFPVSFRFSYFTVA
jgi:hypothetical protein